MYDNLLGATFHPSFSVNQPPEELNNILLKTFLHVLTSSVQTCKTVKKISIKDISSRYVDFKVKVRKARFFTDSMGKKVHYPDMYFLDSYVM